MTRLSNLTPVEKKFLDDAVAAAERVSGKAESAEPANCPEQGAGADRIVASCKPSADAASVSAKAELFVQHGSERREKKGAQWLLNVLLNCLRRFHQGDSDFGGITL
ncbi:hypothetical protein [Candidatus Pantoea multigeneris]|uniref:hypothetical protein n=1 Tax=Candidatus Pantoea multigeneris TaxID=2608357 RepID=UPI001422449E|nr:hypothetical protein [Pantoea multigeneris]